MQNLRALGAPPPDPRASSGWGLRPQTRAWYGMENGMERKFRYGIWKMPEWNGMEDFKNGMEDNLPYFHTNSILDFVHCIYRKIHTDVG